MGKRDLTGSRIRARRLDCGIGQATLARRVGISPAYLSLIEHNRRSIGGKLLLDIATGLGVEPVTLSPGADMLKVDALNEAAAGFPEAAAGPDDTAQFVGRFPGWADLVVRQHGQIRSLSRLVETLSDRLAHDPQFAASMHEVLSVVTAIRSAAGILTSDVDIEPEWQARFRRNLYEDSRRLAQGMDALVEMLDTGGDLTGGSQSLLPAEELERWLSEKGFHIPELEGPQAMSADELLEQTPQLQRTPALRAFSRAYLQRYRRDAGRVPMNGLMRAMAQETPDPQAIAAELGCDLACVLRRIACMPAESGIGPVGIVLCDASGTLVFRKPVDGFSIPRFGAACPIWPLFQALSRPMAPLVQRLDPAGPRLDRFVAVAISQPTGGTSLRQPQTFEATMLLVADDPHSGFSRAMFSAAADPLKVGSGCRVCSVQDCVARREPSILPGAGGDERGAGHIL